MTNGATPLVGETVNEATGGRLMTDIVFVAVELAPTLSATVRVAV
jgi:hypothetical protein